MIIDLHFPEMPFKVSAAKESLGRIMTVSPSTAA
jgi:hypothetical protein